METASHLVWSMRRCRNILDGFYTRQLLSVPLHMIKILFEMVNNDVSHEVRVNVIELQSSE